MSCCLRHPTKRESPPKQPDHGTPSISAKISYAIEIPAVTIVELEIAGIFGLRNNHRKGSLVIAGISWNFF
jgi:hypothetical protein